MNPRRIMILLLFLAGPLLAACQPRYPGPAMTTDGVSFTFSAPQATSVAITGSFNSWDAHGDALAGPDPKGLWHIVLALPEGRYEYLFLVDGSKWQTDPAVPQVDDGFGGKNSVIVIGGGHSL